MKKSIIFILLLCLGFTLFAQEETKTIFVMEGIVTDENNEPVSEVIVYLKDKVGMNAIGTTTDESGKFSIKAVKGDVIVVSYVGYKPFNFTVTEEKKDIEIHFSESEQLDEVVVVGMGTQRRVSSLSAVSSVDVKDLQTPVSSIASLLGGRVAGVISMQASGEPGKNLGEFWVRGIGTFGGGAGALVLIDGLEGDINAIDAADIESFSVLKDASATAVYGVRGANGVILVTTKKGEEGKLSITVRSNFTISKLRRLPNFLRAYDYARLKNEAREVRGEKALYTPIELDIIRDGLDPDMYPDVNWQDEILNPVSFRHSYFTSARGGGSIARYYLSLGFSDESAAYKQDKNSIYSSNVGYNTYSFRTNLDMNLTKSTVVFFGADGFLSILNRPGFGNTDYLWFAQSELTPLLFPTQYSTGEFPAVGLDNSLISPYVLLNHTGNASDEQYNGKVTLALNQDLSLLTEGLKLRVQGAYDIRSDFNETRFIRPALHHAEERNAMGELVLREISAAQTAVYDKGQNRTRQYQFEANLNYDRVFNKDHRTSGLVNYMVSDYKNVAAANSSLSAVPVRYVRLASRLTYGYKDTYMMDFNFGFTGSENFQPGKQYGFFPSIAIGWIPTNYKWVKEKLSWINFFKIRVSQGSVGNDQIQGTGRFPYLTLVNTEKSPIWGSTIYTETVNEQVVGADNLVWERAIKTNIGIDSKFFKDKITLTVDIFNDQRNGIFRQRTQVPDYVGLINVPYGNTGKMRSYGSDGTISFSHEITKHMGFTIRGNYTYARNMVQNWEQTYLEHPYLEHTGFPYSVIRGYHSLGLFKDEDDVKYSPDQSALGGGTKMPGDIKYKDINGDGRITPLDQVPLSYGNQYPLLMYGVGGEFRYKNLSVGILLKGTGKSEYLRIGAGNDAGYDPFYNADNGNVLSIVADPHNRWIPMDYALANGIDPALAENPNAMFPRLNIGWNTNNLPSDFWKSDARYLKLQEITVNYNIKNNTLKKVGISSLNVQLIGTNLYTWDKVKLFDPEQAYRNGRVYPFPSTFSLQLYINF